MYRRNRKDGISFAGYRHVEAACRSTWKKVDRKRYSVLIFMALTSQYSSPSELIAGAGDDLSALPVEFYDSVLIYVGDSAKGVRLSDC